MATSSSAVASSEGGRLRAPLRSDVTAQVVRRVRAATSAGTPILVVVRGEAGSGKSTFAHEVAAAVGDRVVVQTSIAAEANFAHVALTDLVEELAALCGGAPTPLASGDDTPTTPVLGLHLRDRLAAAAAAGTVVVVVDDLQWIDRDSLDVVAFALRRLRDVPVAVLVTVRTEPGGGAGDGEDRGDHPGHGRRLEAVERVDVELEPVPTPRLRALVRQTAPDLTADDLDAVVAQAGGNPFWAVELARSGAARAGSDVDLRRASPTARERLAALASALTDEQRLVVAAVRLAGRPHTDELLAAVGADCADPRAAVEAAERAGVVRLAGQRWTTAHPLLGEAALQVLPSSRRTGLLRRLATAAADPERRVRFAAEVERPPHEPTARALADVAEWAAARGSLASAVWLLERAVEFTADTDERWRGERLAALASLHLRRGAFGDVLATAEQVDLDLLEPSAFDAFAAAVADAAALVHGRDHAQRVVAQVEASAARRGDPMSRAVAAALTADRDYGTAHDPDAVAEHAAAVLETAQWPSPATHMVLGSLCTLRLDRGDGLDLAVVERRRRLEPTLRAAGLLPPSTDSADALAAYVSKQLGDPEASLTRLPALVEAADRGGEDFAGFAFRVHLAAAHQLCGEFAASRRVLVEARERRGWVPPARFPLLLPALATQAMADESVDAAAELVTRETAGLERGPARWQIVVAFLAGTVALEQGRLPEALHGLERAMTTAVDLGIHEPGRRFDVDTALVETHLALGDLDAAAARLQTLDAFARPRGRRNVVAAVDRLAGTLHGLQGDPDRAVAELTAAVDRVARLPFRVEHARTLLALAETHARGGDARAAAEAFDAARGRYAAMSYAAGVDLVERRRREFRADDDPTALTPSERAVVGAVVAGATARQAGLDLSISHRTVEAHLRSVYRKLGVRGRVELTALALRGELDRRT